MPTPPTTSSPLTTREVWRSTPVRRLLIGNGILYSGIALQSTALLKQAYDITGRKSDLGWMGLAEFIPIFALVLVTGTVADHFNRKAIALITVGAEVFTSGALMLYALTTPTSVMPLFMIAFAFGIARAFQAPAMRSMPPMVAPAGALPKVIALYSATWTGAIIVGPAIGGFLYAVSPWVAYLGSTVLIFGSWLVLSMQTFVREPPPPDPDARPTLRTAVEGLVFIRHTPVILAAIALDLFAVLFGGAVALI
ncbi:MAG TPA: MFS transporter, partial [Ilumatobacteraceae bacterium]|nr:MFS transporter [Ilumatobacteraceae bacterium]